MVVRRAFRDLAFAVLLVLPLATFAHLNPSPAKGPTFASADSPPAAAGSRIGLLG